MSGGEAWDEYFADLGPFYADDGARRLLGNISQRALEQRRRRRTVLAVRTADQTQLYPAWQFSETAGIRPSLIPVIRALRGADPWSASIWLISSHPDLDGRSPREALRDGEDPEVVARLALHDQAEFGA